MAEIVSIKKVETKLQQISVHILTFCERDVIQAKCKVESHFIDPFSPSKSATKLHRLNSGLKGDNE